MEIYIPQPVVVDNTLHFQARIPHDGHWIIITKPSDKPITLRYGSADETSVVVPHDRYDHDPDGDIHHAVYTLPSRQRISVIWIPRPMTYHHIHIQTPRLLVQITPASIPNTHRNPV